MHYCSAPIGGSRKKMASELSVAQSCACAGGAQQYYEAAIMTCPLLEM